MFLANNANFFLCAALITRFYRSLELLLMSKTDLNWIKDLVQTVINPDDLKVLEAADGSLDLMIGLEGLKEPTVAIGCELE